MSVLDIFRPKWKHSNFHIRQEAVANMDDVQILGKIASHDSEVSVRDTAVQQLSDLALNDDNENTRIAAISFIPNQDLMEGIIASNAPNRVRIAAVRQIKDPKMLSEVALNDSSRDVRYAAIRKVTDEDVLALVAIRDRSSKNRRYSAERITKQELLSEIAQTTQDAEIKKQVIPSIQDQELLKEISLYASNTEIRLHAVPYLTDQETLVLIAKNDDNLRIAKEACLRITDESLRESLMVDIEDRSATCERELSAERMEKEIRELKKIAEATHRPILGPDVRIASRGKSTNKAKLPSQKEATPLAETDEQQKEPARVLTVKEVEFEEILIQRVRTRGLIIEESIEESSES